MKTLIAEIIKCKRCGQEFGNDVKECDKCHSHICPYCEACNCKNDIFVGRLYGKFSIN